MPNVPHRLVSGRVQDGSLTLGPHTLTSDDIWNHVQQDFTIAQAAWVLCLMHDALGELRSQGVTSVDFGGWQVISCWIRSSQRLAFGRLRKCSPLRKGWTAKDTPPLTTAYGLPAGTGIGTSLQHTTALPGT